MIWGEGRSKHKESPKINTTTVAVDLAKEAFQLAVADKQRTPFWYPIYWIQEKLQWEIATWRLSKVT